MLRTKSMDNQFFSMRFNSLRQVLDIPVLSHDLSHVLQHSPSSSHYRKSIHGNTHTSSLLASNPGEKPGLHLSQKSTTRAMHIFHSERVQVVAKALLVAAPARGQLETMCAARCSGKGF